MTAFRPSPAPPRAHFAYRPDIDGLRAVAVSVVVLFHYGLPGFSGGFIGVDVFFVISGFLITGLVAGELAQQQFSLVGFYVRRVRRIFPALFSMLAVTTVAANFILFPDDLRLFGHAVLATALFATNFEFLREMDYFRATELQRPLLHLWSIAVEEQFYLVFPALLMLTVPRGRRAALWLVAGLALASFAASEWLVRVAPDWAFYLLPTRVWELMLGAGLALAEIAPPHARWLCDCLALAGLALIAFAVWHFDSGTAFPGANALYPCLGAALIIWAGSGPETGLVSWILSSRPLVGLGLISYSLYLWHWPVYVFTHYALFRPMSAAETAACLAASVILAVLSWRYVERPFRLPMAQPLIRRRPLRLAAAAMAVTAVVGGIILIGDGFAFRYPPATRRILAETRDDDGLRHRCFGLSLTDIDTAHLCRFGAAETVVPSFILWGDSHADALRPAIGGAAAAHGLEGYFAGQPSCAPLLGVSRANAPGCKRFNDRVLAFVTAHPEIKTVILDAVWARSANGTSFGHENDSFVPIADAQGIARKPADNAAIFARGLERMVAALRAERRDVVLIGPVPEVGWAVPIMLAHLQLVGEPAWPGPSLADYRARQHNVIALFERLGAQRGVRTYYPSDYLCRSGTCAVEGDGVPFYRDEHHLSAYGAKTLTPALASLFERAPRS